MIEFLLGTIFGSVLTALLAFWTAYLVNKKTPQIIQTLAKFESVGQEKAQLFPSKSDSQRSVAKTIERSDELGLDLTIEDIDKL